MRSPKPAFLTAALALLVFWALVSPALAQGSGMTVSSDYELFGATDLNGGGHVTWTLAGDAARTLRADIVHLYDEYSQIPAGFTFLPPGQATSGNHDGIIEAPEGQTYTNHVETILEGTYPGSTTGGTQVGYFLLDRSTLLEKDLLNGFNRSTSGIVGTNASTTGDLQIKFLFNGATSTADATVRNRSVRAAAKRLGVTPGPGMLIPSWQLPAPNLLPGRPSRPSLLCPAQALPLVPTLTAMIW